jgi:predicted transcriptional regulator
MKRKGYYGRSQEHSLNAHGVSSSPVYFCSNGIKTVEQTAEYKQRAFKRVPKGAYSNLPMLLGVPTTIQTMDGMAHYVGTEIEHNGRWNQSYVVSAGEYVIHDGTNHHIYIINTNRAGFESDGIKEDLNKISKKTDKHATTTAKKVSAYLSKSKAETKEILKKADEKLEKHAKKVADYVSSAAKETKRIKDDAAKKLDDHATETAKDLNKIFKKLK